MLDRILAQKRAEIERLDLPALRRAAAQAPPPRDFAAALTSHPPPPSPLADGDEERGGGGSQRRGQAVRLIAELKRASPSRGLLAPHLDLLDVARTYVENGAAAISVLTDEKFFLGSLSTLRALREAGTGVPLLRKDFILHPAQVYEARAAGADAILLIAAALPDAQYRRPAGTSPPAGTSLRDLHALALDLGLTPLVEVHDREELDRVLALPGLRLVGINNRNLKTFEVSLETTAALRPHIPAGVGVVAESGLFTAADAARMAALDVDAILVGEALVTAPDIAAKVRELAGAPAPADGDAR